RIVALPEGLRALAYDRAKNVGIIQPAPNHSAIRLDVGVGMASACYSAMVYGLLANPKITTADLLEGALRFAQAWMKRELEWFRSPAGVDPLKELTIDADAIKRYDPVGTFTQFSWDREGKDWLASMKVTGII